MRELIKKLFRAQPRKDWLHDALDTAFEQHWI